MAERIPIGDTAIIESEIVDEDGTTPVPVIAAIWEIVAPDTKQIIVSVLPSSPTTGTKVMLNQDDGGFFINDVVQWNGLVWTRIDTGESAINNNQAIIKIPGTLTNEVGLYRGRVQFTTENGTKKSNLVIFETVDPFAAPIIGPASAVVDKSWMMFEDCFDSDLGGPWLRDKTLAIFDKDKMARLLPEALYTINLTYEPTTNFDEKTFPYNPHAPLLERSLLIESIYHLMRSYVEQWIPANNAAPYFDRRDYLTRWQSILQLEEARFYKQLDLFKRDQMGFGSTALLVGGYSGWVSRAPRYMRSRYPYIFRY